MFTVLITERMFLEHSPSDLSINKLSPLMYVCYLSCFPKRHYHIFIHKSNNLGFGRFKKFSLFLVVVVEFIYHKVTISYASFTGIS